MRSDEGMADGERERELRGQRRYEEKEIFFKKSKRRGSEGRLEVHEKRSNNKRD